MKGVRERVDNGKFSSIIPEKSEQIIEKSEMAYIDLLLIAMKVGSYRESKIKSI